MYVSVLTCGNCTGALHVSAIVSYNLQIKTKKIEWNQIVEKITAEDGKLKSNNQKWKMENEKSKIRN